MHIHTPLDFGLVIRDTRRARALSQHQLATAVGVSRQWVLDIEHGKPRAELGLVLRTLAVLGLRLTVAGSGAAPEAAPIPEATIDLDAIIERARGKQP